MAALVALAFTSLAALACASMSFPSDGGYGNISRPLLPDPCYLGFLAVSSGDGPCNATVLCPAECHDELEGLLATCSESATSGMMSGMLSGMMGGINASRMGGMSGMAGMMGGRGSPGQMITMFAPTGVELPVVLASLLAARGSACASAPVDAFLESVGSNLTCSDSLALLSVAWSPNLCGDSDECSLECRRILELPFGVCSATEEAEEVSVGLLEDRAPDHGLNAQELVALVGTGLFPHCAAHLLDQNFEDGATHPCLVGVSSVFEGTLVRDSCVLAGDVCSDACATSLEGVIAQCDGFTSPVFDYDRNHAPLPAGYMASEVILALAQEGHDACFIAPLQAVLQSGYQASCLDALELIYVANTVCWTHDIDQQECPEACKLMIDAPFELCGSMELGPEFPYGGIPARSITFTSLAGPLGMPVPGGLSYACGDYASTKTFLDGGPSPFRARPSGTTEAPDADGAGTTGKVAETTLVAGTPSLSPAPSPAPSPATSPATSPADDGMELDAAPRTALPAAALACAGVLFMP